MKTTQKFKHARGLGDSWSNNIRAAPIPNNPMINHYKQTSTQKQNQNQNGTTATPDYT
ncbi:hypothetical protein ACLD5X_05195 [Gardnerella vaginalis]